MFVIELFFPFLLLCGRTGRRMAALAFISLMTLIALTGNYCFFNILVIALSLPLLDNAFLRRLASVLRQKLPQASDGSRDAASKPPAFSWAAFAAAPLLLLGFWCGAVQTAATLFQIRPMPRWAALPLEWAAPFRTINNYGLFAVMTKTRPEFILEDSADGKKRNPLAMNLTIYFLALFSVVIISSTSMYFAEYQTGGLSSVEAKGDSHPPAPAGATHLPAHWNAGWRHCPTCGKEHSEPRSSPAA